MLPQTWAGLGAREAAWLGRHNGDRGETASPGGTFRTGPTQMIPPLSAGLSAAIHTFGATAQESAVEPEMPCRGDSLNGYHHSLSLRELISEAGGKIELWD